MVDLEIPTLELKSRHANGTVVDEPVAVELSLLKVRARVYVGM